VAFSRRLLRVRSSGGFFPVAKTESIAIHTRAKTTLDHSGSACSYLHSERGKRFLSVHSTRSCGCRLILVAYWIGFRRNLRPGSILQAESLVGALRDAWRLLLPSVARGIRNRLRSVADLFLPPSTIQF
jgi:hypothetical protein